MGHPAHGTDEVVLGEEGKKEGMDYETKGKLMNVIKV